MKSGIECDNQEPDLGKLKAEAKRLWGEVEGVQGFGIGDRRLRVYLRDAAVRNRLPTEFQGVPIEFVVTGDITARS